MRLDPGVELEQPVPCGALSVAGEEWHIYVLGTNRAEGDWFMELALVGPEFRTATVRLASPIDRAAAARYVVRAISAWLSAAGERTHLFIDSVATEAFPKLESAS